MIGYLNVAYTGRVKVVDLGSLFRMLETANINIILHESTFFFCLTKLKCMFFYILFFLFIFRIKNSLFLNLISFQYSYMWKISIKDVCVISQCNKYVSNLNLVHKFTFVGNYFCSIKITGFNITFL